MDIPVWKKYLSYFKDVSLEETSSQYNAFLEVLLVNGRKQLVTEDAIYSFDDKYENFNQTFKQINWQKKVGDEALVLGLGLGSVILLLEKFHKVSFNYTAVEIDPEICLLAQKYTLSNLSSFVETLNTDAYLYLQASDKKFDLVIMDVFENALIPENFQSIEYLKMLESKLNKSGILLYNRMNKTDDDRFQNMQFEKKYSSVFPEYEILEIKDNIILVNDKNCLH